MTVYVESNFVLEIALGQREAAFAETILMHALESGVELAVPSIALLEPFSRVMHKGRKRRRFMTRMKKEINDMNRSLPHQAEVQQLEPMAPLFSRVEQREISLLTKTVQRLFEAATVVEVNGDIYGEAIALANDYDFDKFTDAIIASAVLNHLRRNTSAGPHYFATKDRKDFSALEIVQLFAGLDCKIIYKFEECVQRLRLNRLQ